MRVAFIDDSKQDGKRRDMGRLIALGAVAFPEQTIADYAREAEAIYAALDVPLDTELKWSPPRDSFLNSEAGREARSVLQEQLLRLAVEAEARSVVVVWDTGRTILQGRFAEQKVLEFLYERVSMCLEDDIGMMIADRPAGGRAKDDEKWLNLKNLAPSDDRIGAVLAAWRHETNRLPPQRPRPARPPGV